MSDPFFCMQAGEWTLPDMLGIVELCLANITQQGPHQGISINLLGTHWVRIKPAVNIASPDN